MPKGDTFLPRIHSVFYAIFDVKTGPKIVFQVPEGLIAPAASATSLSVTSSPRPSTAVLADGEEQKLSRRSSSSLVSASGQRPSSLRHLSSPQHRSSSSSRTLFNFSDISKYVIPPNPLCGRLVICATGNYRIIGLPVSLPGKYERNFFRFNLCFVFERSANLSCYEPIVRKVSRVLTACEEESMLLSNPQTSLAMYAIIEQLYEDLNSYSETSILIDDFNSIELKILPFYPNPPSVKDWHVPLALINLSKRIEDNWDLTMRKVSQYINGVNHVSRIAQLADCDLELTRQAISHLLYYQVVMTIDTFQYSNMYTLRKNVQWLADEPHAKDECGPYVTKPGKPIPDWPKLLHLYSRFKPGRTVFEWMESYEVHKLGIDVRRFTSFGVIKGFLRRVHRYPVFIPESPSQANRRRRQSFSSSPVQLGTQHTNPPMDPAESGRLPDTPFTVPVHTDALLSSPTREADLAKSIPRRTSAAEKVLEQLRFKTQQRSGTNVTVGNQSSSASAYLEEASTTRERVGRPRVNSEGRRHLIYPQSEVSSKDGRSSWYGPSVGPISTGRPRPSRSPSAPMVPQIHTSFSQGSGQSFNVPPPPPELVSLLDGEHHTDELSTRFEAGWPLLQQWLAVIGGGRGDGDFGRVSIIYR
ncbi:nitrogen permease regulator 2-domain-containing protein [Boletus edulis BED1]|uniref:Nitrogen permease regulator 2-domain-containing protein n=1 Tax=Boletus edulis BED1 TaxID=1328754 RepID=A0AAD4GJK2_BOLED|nr:nitrogen permease regulator 2-domain-containing protein [Boletus edulis BED1]